MATFRKIHTEFWNDPKVVEEMTPEDKYFFLYLLTNDNTTQIGIYQITKKQMAFDMGYSPETINSLLERFLHQHKLIQYNAETREIAINNWGKYNLDRGGKPMVDCVKSELEKVKDWKLAQRVAEGVETPGIKEAFRKYLESKGVTFPDGDDTSTTRGENNEEITRNEETPLNQGFDDTSTIRGTSGGQEEVKEEVKEEEQQQEKEQEDVRSIVQCWDNNGFGLNNMQAKQSLLLWLDDSQFPNPAEMIMKAMDIACASNNRHLKYLEGILRNWQNQSLLTLVEVEVAEQERGLKQNGQKIQNHGASYGRSQGKSYEEAMRELDASNKAFGG